MPDPAETAQPDNSGGCMLALYPPLDVAKALAVDDGLPPEALHCTLVYAGPAADTDAVALNDAARQLAQRAPFTAAVSGSARFTGGDTDVAVALVDSADIEDLRRDAMDLLSAAGVQVPRDHGHTPHITRQYLSADAADPGRLAAFPAQFTTVSAVHGGTRTDYWFTGKPPAADQEAAHPAAPYLREAFAAGWAVSAGPMTSRIQAASLAAVTAGCGCASHPGVFEAVTALGHTEGVQALAAQRREELISAGTAKILVAWHAALRSLDTAALASRLRQAALTTEARTPDEKQRLKDAAAAALAWLLGILGTSAYDTLVSSIAAALAAAAAEGYAGAEATARDITSGPYDWDTGTRQAAALLKNLRHWEGAARETIRQALESAARDLARALETAATATDARKAAADWAEPGDDQDEGSTPSGSSRPFAFWLDRSLWSAVIAGAVAWYQQAGTALLAWNTQMDGRVCPTCQEYADNGPYTPDAYPDAPHGGCRCYPGPA